jgi:hypothetical protein
VICPNCKEDNAPDFRFCGMCGTALESRRPAGASALDPLSAFPRPEPSRAAMAAPQLQPAVAANQVRAARPVPAISGPSMLGLDAPAAPQSDAIPPATNALSMDSLREKSFSGLDSFYEPEKPKAGGRILLLVVLLAALGGAGWWTYRNYLNAAGPRTPENATATVADTPVEKPLTQPESKEDASPPQAAVPETVAGSPAGNTTAAPAPNGKSADEPAVAAPIAKIAPAVKRPAKREPTVASAKTSRPPEPPAADTGDAVRARS